MIMKQFLVLVLALMLTLTMLVACNDDTPEVPDNNNNDKTEQPDNNQPADPDDGKEDEPVKPAKVTYTITIKDQDGNPIAEVEAQICVDGVCKKPNVTDENGVVKFSMDDPGDSTLSLQINEGGSPAGYEYPAEKIAIEAGQTEITITLNKKAQ
jgi:hypothetical protein